MPKITQQNFSRGMLGLRGSKRLSPKDKTNNVKYSLNCVHDEDTSIRTRPRLTETGIAVTNDAHKILVFSLRGVRYYLEYFPKVYINYFMSLPIDDLNTSNNLPPNALVGGAALEPEDKQAFTYISEIQEMSRKDYGVLLGAYTREVASEEDFEFPNTRAKFVVDISHSTIFYHYFKIYKQTTNGGYTEIVSNRAYQFASVGNLPKNTGLRGNEEAMAVLEGLIPDWLVTTKDINTLNTGVVGRKTLKRFNDTLPQNTFDAIKKNISKLNDPELYNYLPENVEYLAKEVDDMVVLYDKKGNLTPIYLFEDSISYKENEELVIPRLKNESELKSTLSETFTLFNDDPNYEIGYPQGTIEENNQSNIYLDLAPFTTFGDSIEMSVASKNVSNKEHSILVSRELTEANLHIKPYFGFLQDRVLLGRLPIRIRGSDFVYYQHQATPHEKVLISNLSGLFVKDPTKDDVLPVFNDTKIIDLSSFFVKQISEGGVASLTTQESDRLSANQTGTVESYSITNAEFPVGEVSYSRSFLWRVVGGEYNVNNRVVSPVAQSDLMDFNNFRVEHIKNFEFDDGRLHTTLINNYAFSGFLNYLFFDPYFLLRLSDERSSAVVGNLPLVNTATSEEVFEYGFFWLKIYLDTVRASFNNSIYFYNRTEPLDPTTGSLNRWADFKASDITPVVVDNSFYAVDSTRRRLVQIDYNRDYDRRVLVDRANELITDVLFKTKIKNIFGVNRGVLVLLDNGETYFGYKDSEDLLAWSHWQFPQKFSAKGFSVSVGGLFVGGKLLSVEGVSLENNMESTISLLPPSESGIEIEEVDDSLINTSKVAIYTNLPKGSKVVVARNENDTGSIETVDGDGVVHALVNLDEMYDSVTIKNNKGGELHILKVNYSFNTNSGVSRRN